MCFSLYLGQGKRCILNQELKALEIAYMGLAPEGKIFGDRLTSRLQYSCTYLDSRVTMLNSKTVYTTIILLTYTSFENDEATESNTKSGYSGQQLNKYLLLQSFYEDKKTRDCFYLLG